MSEEKTCGNCKFFGISDKPSDAQYIPAEYSRCGRVQMAEKYQNEITPATGHKACVVDGSGYYAALCVTTDFGCNQWELKA